MATIKVSTTKSCARAINYAEKRADVKSGYNCDVDHAKQEMATVREMYEKTTGTQAHLVIQAFSPEESQKLGSEKINALGLELAEKIAPNHQATVYTHVDKEHFHNHIVINSVNLENGAKFHQYKEFEFVKELNDELLKVHKLEIVQPEQHFEKHTGAEIQIKRRGGSSWKDEVREKIDSIMSDRSTSDFKTFSERLEEKGIITHKRGNTLSYELLDGHKRVRGSKLGSSYELSPLVDEFNKRSYKKEKIQDNPLQRKPHSNKEQSILKEKEFNSRLRNDFKNRLSSRNNLYPNKANQLSFKASQSLEMISPITVYAPIQKVLKVEKEKSLGLSL